MKNPYEVLGVARTADDAEIKTAFRTLAKEHHPDRNGGSEESSTRFKEINEAYQKIGTADDRRKYDMENRGSAGSTNGASSRYNNWGGMPGGGYGGFNFDLNEMDLDTDSAAIIAEILRRGGHRGAGWTNTREPIRKNDDITTHVRITLRDALLGCSVNLNITHPKTGDRELIVKVPPGIDNGQRIRVQDQGNNQYEDRPKAHLYVVIAIDNGGFEREGSTLYKSVTADALQLMITRSARVETAEGTTLEFEVPTAISGQLIRLQGQGMPLHIGSDKRGDMIIELKISVKTDLSEEQKKLAVQILDLQKP